MRATDAACHSCDGSGDHRSCLVDCRVAPVTETGTVDNNIVVAQKLCRPTSVQDMRIKSSTKQGKPTLVSLFTGAGGLDIGLETAGFSTVSAIDCDADCIETIRMNQARHGYLSNAKVTCSSVEDIHPESLKPDDAGPGWVPDLLAGGPPCQPFSSAGNMLALDDPRGRLFEHFVKIASALRPRMVLFENVRGLVTAVGPSGIPGEALRLVQRSFEDIGYFSRCALLNAADYGLPQRRVRLFMFATNCTALPAFPSPTHGESPEPLFGVNPWRTLGDFLATFPTATLKDGLEFPSEKLLPHLEVLAPGSGLKSAGARESTRPGGHWGYKQGTFMADPGKPARTVTASATQDWIRDRQGRLRRLTWRECAALQGFPRDWEFYGNKASRFRQIGNAVPVMFGQALGKVLVEALSQPGTPAAESAPFPRELVAAAEYTHREHKRNGESRRLVRAALASSSARDRLALKGGGSGC